MIIGQFFAQDHAAKVQKKIINETASGANNCGRGNAPRLLAHNVEHDLPMVWRAAMLEQIDALPGPKDHPPRGDRNGKLRLR